MADEMLETYIRQLLESHRTSEVTVAWQCGEPTMMGLDFFRRAMEVVDRDKRPGQSISIDGPEALVERTADASPTITNRGWSDASRDTRPPYTQAGNSVTDLSVGPAALGTFLMTIFEKWLVHDVGEVFVLHFVSALANWRGEPGAVCAGRAPSEASKLLAAEDAARYASVVHNDPSPCGSANEYTRCHGTPQGASTRPEAERSRT